MACFGDYLRDARESRSVSLEQISSVTRISVRLLEALENEQFDLLPGGVFTISFVRQYAHWSSSTKKKPSPASSR